MSILGWAGFVLAALEAVSLVAPSPYRLPPSNDDRAEPDTVLSEVDAKLGRRR